MSNKEKEELQLKLLKEVVKRAYENVPYYKNRFDKLNIRPEDIQTLKDIEKLPFTTKTDLRDAYPFGMFAVPEEEIIEVHTSSGTTGKPTVSGYTQKDLEIWGEVMGRALTMAGAGRKDKIQNCYGYGLFTGGLGVHYGTQAGSFVRIDSLLFNTQPHNPLNFLKIVFLSFFLNSFRKSRLRVGTIR